MKKSQPAHIVLIEDNPADVLLVEMALEENGIDCYLTKFENSEGGVEFLSSAEGEKSAIPDLILMDLNTPRSDGFESIRKLRRFPRVASVPVVIVTSSRARTDKLQAAELGVAYIEKSLELEVFFNSLGRAVKEILDKESKTASAELSSETHAGDIVRP